MALFYMNVRNVAKAKQSAVAKASYVSGEKLFSERDEEMKAYRTREVHPDSFILAPSHAPEWVHDRQTLWNQAEQIETAVNARVMREVVVALPIEMTDEQQKELLVEYVQENFVDAGMVADVNIHKDREQNPHAHILLTVRPFKENGEWFDHKTKKEYLLDSNGDFIYNEKGNKKARSVDLTGWSGKEKIVEWRKNLAEKINEHYQKNGIEKSVSHLSYEDQGLDKKAIERLTRGEYAIEKQAEKKAEEAGIDYVPVTHYGKMNQVIKAFNLEIETLNQSIENMQVEIENIQPTAELVDFEDIRRKVFEKTGLSSDESRLMNIAYSDSVDYRTTSETLKSISSWNDALVMQEREIFGIKSVLDNALKRYENGDDDLTLMKYGFNRDSFEEMYAERALSLSEKYESLQNEIEEYTEAKAFVSHANDLQIELLREEFAFQFSSFDKVTEMDSERVIKLMLDAVESVEVDEIDKALSGLKPYLSSEERQLEFVKENVSDLTNEYTRLSTDLEKMKETVEFEKNRYSSNVNSDLQNNNPDKLNSIYFGRYNFFNAKNQMESIEKEMKNITKTLDDYLTDYARETNNKWLKDFSMESKVDALLNLDKTDSPESIKNQLENLSGRNQTVESIVETYVENDNSNVLKYGFVRDYVEVGLNKLNIPMDQVSINELLNVDEEVLSTDSILSARDYELIRSASASYRLNNQLMNSELFTRKNILDNALKTFENGDYDKLFKYGFETHSFADEFNRRTLSLEQDFDAFQDELKDFKDQRTSMNEVLKSDTRKTVKEFVETFPSLKEIQNVDLRRTDAVLYMKQAIETYEDESKFISSYEHKQLMNFIEPNEKETMQERSRLGNLLTMKNKIYEVAAQRENKIVELEPLYKSILGQAKNDSSVLPKVFELRNELYINSNELNKLNKEIKAIDEQFKESIEKVAPDIDVKQLSSIGMDRIIEEFSTGSDKETIRTTIEEEIENPSTRNEPTLEEKRKMNEVEEDENQNSQQSPEELAGDLLASIIEQAQKKQDSTDHNRKKRTHKKLTIEEKLDRDML